MAKVEGSAVIIKRAKMNWVKLDPKNPEKGFETEDRYWSLQLITNDPEQTKAWRAAGLNVKLMQNKPEKDEFGDPLPPTDMLDENGKKQWKVNLRRPEFIKSTGERNKPVNICDGSLNPIDPNTVGNGSIGNIKVWVRPYKADDGTTKTSTSLLAVQVVKYIKRDQDSGPGFDMTETEVVEAERDDDDDDDDFDQSSASSTPSAPPTPSAPKAPVKTADEHPEDAF